MICMPIDQEPVVEDAEYCKFLDVLSLACTCVVPTLPAAKPNHALPYVIAIGVGMVGVASVYQVFAAAVDDIEPQ